MKFSIDFEPMCLEELVGFRDTVCMLIGRMVFRCHMVVVPEQVIRQDVGLFSVYHPHRECLAWWDASMCEDFSSHCLHVFRSVRSQEPTDCARCVRAGFGTSSCDEINRFDITASIDVEPFGFEEITDVDVWRTHEVWCTVSFDRLFVLCVVCFWANSTRFLSCLVEFGLILLHHFSLNFSSNI